MPRPTNVIILWHIQVSSETKIRSFAFSVFTSSLVLSVDASKGPSRYHLLSLLMKREVFPEIV